MYERQSNIALQITTNLCNLQILCNYDPVLLKASKRFVFYNFNKKSVSFLIVGLLRVK